jgi:hypothetical protein
LAGLEDADVNQIGTLAGTIDQSTDRFDRLASDLASRLSAASWSGPMRSCSEQSGCWSATNCVAELSITPPFAAHVGISVRTVSLKRGQDCARVVVTAFVTVRAALARLMLVRVVESAERMIAGSTSSLSNVAGTLAYPESVTTRRFRYCLVKLSVLRLRCS